MGFYPPVTSLLVFLVTQRTLSGVLDETGTGSRVTNSSITPLSPDHLALSRTILFTDFVDLSVLSKNVVAIVPGMWISKNYFILFFVGFLRSGWLCS